ncbi:MAG: TerB family tellurite resistance protein [Syntrophotaleaceae bacterium]
MLKKLGRLLQPKNGAESENRFGNLHLARAVLLLEMVHVDFAGEPIEEEFVFHALREGFDLTGEETRQLLAHARQEREKSLDLHQFTRQINEACSREEKTSLLETFWRLAHVDGKIDKYEEALMRRLTTLLRLSHRQMIEAKLKVREELGLRRSDGSIRPLS